MRNDYIRGGTFQIARQIFESDLWNNKPATWKVIWIYILGNVSHKKTNKFERGEGFFNFSKSLRLIGNDITEDMVKKFCAYARKSEMMSTLRSTRGMLIKVLNYDKYQTLGNYIRTSISTREAREKHERSTPIYKNDKNDKNNTTEQSSGENPPFNLTKEIDILLESTRRDHKIIGFYFRAANLDIPSRAVFIKELKRGLAETKTLKDYPSKKIKAAMDIAMKQYPIWSLQTVSKIITKM